LIHVALQQKIINIICIMIYVILPGKSQYISNSSERIKCLQFKIFLRCGYNLTHLSYYNPFSGFWTVMMVQP
jgi:hypothetical protein